MPSNHFTLDYTNKIIGYTDFGTDNTRFTVQELYSYLMDVFDDASQMDDQVPMSAQTPSEFTLINGWFISDDTMNYLQGGAIQTDGWDGDIRKISLASAGYTNCVASDIGKTVTGGTTGDTGVLLGYDNTNYVWWIRMIAADDLFDNASEALTIGTGTGAGTMNAVSATGECVFANFYTLGTIVSDSVVYWEQNGSLIPVFTGYDTGWEDSAEATYGPYGHCDQLIRVVDFGTTIDSRKITGYSRNLGDTYDHFEVTASATGGRNPVPLATSVDANDDEGGGSEVGITIAFGTVSRDIGDGAGAQNYDVEIDGNNLSVLDVYTYLKYITRRENTSAIDNPEETTEGRFYQSVNPATYALAKSAPFGTFAGGKFFGARGIWLTNVSDPNNRELIDAAGVTRTPPTSITVQVTGLESGDRVMVAKSTGSGSRMIDKDQYTISAVTSSTIQATVSLDADTPSTGNCRVGDTVYAYTGVSDDTLTGVTPDPTGETGSFYIPYVDKVSSGTSVAAGTMIYDDDEYVVARVRKSGILPFENTGIITDAGLTVSAIRTNDTIVT